jgi:hypothetical protein
MTNINQYQDQEEFHETLQRLERMAKTSTMTITHLDHAPFWNLKWTVHQTMGEIHKVVKGKIHAKEKE